jgi:hypothetical protein
MIRKVLAFFRFATKAERLMLAYKACGYTEDEVFTRWKADLARAMLAPEQPLTATTTSYEGRSYLNTHLVNAPTETA